LSELADKVDTIITISNDKLLQVIDKKTSLLEAFNIADDVLRQGVQGIAEIITVPGIINADFADVKAVMANAGSALMGIGQASGENRAVEAAKMAINSSLLDMSIDGARGIVFTITGGPDLSMNEVSEAARVITSAADEEAKIIFGAVINEEMKDQIKITVVATGFDGKGKNNASEPRSYSPNSFIAEQEQGKDKGKADVADIWSVKKKEGSRVSNFIKNPIKPLIEKKAQSPKPILEEVDNRVKGNDEDDDLSVPAFIRKKML